MGYWDKQPSSRILKAQNIFWAGTGTAFTTNFTAQTYQIRVISATAGYISITATTGDGTVATTANVGTFIPAATSGGEYFTVTPGMILGYASTTTSTAAAPILNITEMS